MGYQPLDSLDEITKNRYEAVLVAARRARQLNAIRLAKLEMLSPENADQIDIDSRKVTAIALKDCLEGKVKFEREE
jgi:DNA-directed RNA polymerase omega subunit